MEKPLDKSMHRTKVCFLDSCKGSLIKGGHTARHLRQVHKLSDSQIRNWKEVYKGSIRNVEHPEIIQQHFNWANPRSCWSKS